MQVGACAEQMLRQRADSAARDSKGEHFIAPVDDNYYYIDGVLSYHMIKVSHRSGVIIIDSPLRDRPLRQSHFRPRRNRAVRALQGGVAPARAPRRQVHRLRMRELWIGAERAGEE